MRTRGGTGMRPEEGQAMRLEEGRGMMLEEGRGIMLEEDVDYLVDVVHFTQVVKCHIHGIEHAHHLHGVESGAHRCEAHNVTEQNRHGREFLACVESSLTIT